MDSTLLNKIDKTRMPRHVAIIMDGNGRWAKSKGLPRVEGHRQGALTVDVITEAARTIGIKYLTLYAFSKENWGRPSDEVDALMNLLMEYLETKLDKMRKNGIRLGSIGHLDRLPQSVKARLDATIAATAGGREMVLTLALSYGARDEMIRAIRSIVQDVAENKLPVDFIDETFFSARLDTKNLPDPDLVIRTSGENRISNFLLWQGAYAEYAFVKPCWPEFSDDMFMQCLIDYQERERRFGKTSEQLD